jgi:hypothetical protein
MKGKQKFELWSDGGANGEYSGNFTAAFPQDIVANVAKAYQVIAFPSKAPRERFSGFHDFDVL